jgi:hypothetical protein
MSTRLTAIAFLLSSVSLNTFADEIPPSDQSIRQLLAVTEASKTVEKIADDLTASVDSSVKKIISQTLGDKPANEDQEKIFDNLELKIIEIIHSEYVWAKFEPIYLNIYRTAFTQNEVNGMLAFYKTPAGQAVITKMPVVAQATIAAINNRGTPVAQQLKKVEDEAIAAAKAKN